MFTKRTSPECPSLALALVDAVRSWWRHDQIRVSPREGRLLVVGVPCVLEVEGELFEITRRTIGNSKAGTFVVYQGHAAADDTPCKLECRPGQDHVHWQDTRGVCVIDNSEISVY